MRRISCQAFSLIELLVVISIVALLIALLAPALQKSRDVALSTKCAAHLKQIGTTIFMYGDANKDWMPTSGYAHTTAYPGMPNWAGIAAETMGTKYITEYTINNAMYNQPLAQNATTRKNGVMQCPSDIYRGYWGANLGSTSYGWNDSNYGMGRCDSHTTLPGLKRMRRTEIVAPSKMIALGDWTKGHSLVYEYQHGQLDGTSNLTLGVLHGENVNLLYNDGRAGARKRNSVVANDFDRRYF